jgi:WD40 repeat protein
MIDAVRLAGEGRQVLVSGVAGARLYDLETGQEVRRFQEEAEEVNQADLSPDGRWLLTGSFDGKVRLWDFAGGELVRVLGSHDGFVFSVAFSPDGRFAASAGGGENHGGNFVRGSDHDIRLWDLTSLRAASAGSPEPRSGGWLAAAGGLMLATALCLVGVYVTVRHSQRARLARAALAVSSGRGGQGVGTDQPVTSAAPTPPVTLSCPGCAKNLRVRADLAGRKVKCPQCGQAVLVPAD